MTIEANTLTLMGQIGIDTALKKWYISNTDAVADINTDGYILGAGVRGVSVGDIVDHQNSTTKTITRFVVTSIDATTDNADLSDGTTISDGTDSD